MLYEDTLVELQDTAERAGFSTIAAVAAIAEHSIAHQFATGRPDAQDAQQLAEFAKQIGMKIATGNDTQPSFPGNRPYKKAGLAGLIPNPTKDCVNCGFCPRAGYQHTELHKGGFQSLHLMYALCFDLSSGKTSCSDRFPSPRKKVSNVYGTIPRIRSSYYKIEVRQRW